MPIILPSLKIAYFPAPKCACSSVKEQLFHAEQGHGWNGANFGGVNIHHYWRQLRGFETVDVQITEETYRACNNMWSFAVVRDPVKRLLSAFANRVEHHGEIRRGGNPDRQKKAKALGVSLTPDISSFFHNFETFRELDESVAHHTQPQADFVGDDLSRLSVVYPIENLSQLRDDLFEHTGLDAPIPREQTGGKKYKIADLDERAVESLKSATAKEYEHLKAFYSPPW